MTVETVDFNIVPTDGWVQIGTNPTLLIAKPGSSVPWAVAVTSTGDPASEAQATGTLTLAGNAVANETVTIGSVTYTWKASASAANEVTVGASASASIDNLVAAVNNGSGTGGVQNPDASAVKASASTMTVTARAAGSAGNSVATTETMTNGSFGGATLASGADAVRGLVFGKDAGRRMEAFELTATISGNVFARNLDSTGNVLKLGVVRDQ